jgi:hypothetical protein
MTTSALGATSAAPLSLNPRLWWAELLRREPTLALFALIMALALLPTLVAMGLDERLFRGVSIWAKPLKFMASVSLFAFSTAWFMGLLPSAARARRPVRWVVWTLVIAGAAEVAYISLQAALGQASHYNATSLFHRLAYQLMGVGALLMMLTQLVLAQQIARHARVEVDRAWRDAVVLALVMTFVLGVGAAALLASAQPPAGAGVPVLGWHLGGGDLRPAHFIGSHAQQLVPLAGWLLLRVWPARARPALWVFALGYTGLWLLALLRGLHGAVWLPPPV